MAKNKYSIKLLQKRVLSVALATTLSVSNFANVVAVTDSDASIPTENVESEDFIYDDEDSTLEAEDQGTDLEDDNFEDNESDLEETETEETEEFSDEVEEDSENLDDEFIVEAESSNTEENLLTSTQSVQKVSSDKNHNSNSRTSKVTLIDDSGVATMSELVTIESGGFESLNLEEGNYAVPISFKNITDTSIEKTSSNAISDAVDDEIDGGVYDKVAILSIDSDGNSSLSLTLKQYSTSGYGSSLAEVLQTRESYLSNVKYFKSLDDSTFEEASATVTTGDETKPEVAKITISDTAVNGMYVSYTQNSVDGGYSMDTYAYLDIDYSNLVEIPEPVFIMGSLGVSMTAGTYPISVSLLGTNSSSSALSSSIGELIINNDGSASVTVGFTTYGHSEGFAQNYTRFIGVLNGDASIEVLAGTDARPTKVKFEIADITKDDIVFKHNAYRTNSSTTIRDNQVEATLTMNYFDYVPAPEYTDEELSRKFTFGEDRTMLSPGTYDISVYFRKADDITASSMAGSSLVEDAVLIVDADGNGEIIAEFQPITIVVTGNPAEVSYYTEYGYGDDGGDLLLAETISMKEGWLEKVKIPYVSPYRGGFFFKIKTEGSYESNHDAYMQIDLSGIANSYAFDESTVTLRPGEEEYWSDDADKNAPVISIDGYSASTIVELETGDELDNFTVPTATAIDDVDGAVDVSIYYASFDSDDIKIDDLASLDDAKSYLNEAIGNRVRVYYSATDSSGNVSRAYLLLVSCEVDTNSYADVTQDGVYSVPIKLLKESDDSLSMGDEAFDDFRTAKVTTSNNSYFVEVEVGTVTVGITAGIENVTAVSSAIYDLVESETSTTSDGIEYTSKFDFKTDTLEDTYMINFDIAGLNMNHNARLDLDFDKAFIYGNEAPADITDKGTFTVPVEMYQETSNSLSMGDPVFDDNRSTNVYNMGDYYVFEVDMGIMSLGGMTLGVDDIISTDDDIMELSYETKFSSDITQGTGNYISKVVFTTKEIKDFYDIAMLIEIHGDSHVGARLKYNWKNLSKVSSSTSGVPSLDGGSESLPDNADVAPTIIVAGYKNNETVSIPLALIDILTLPTAIVSDDVDTNLTASVSYSSNSTDFSNFEDAKTYLKKSVGNEVTITYTAVDSSNNQTTFTINLVSKEDVSSDDGLLKNNTSYSVPVELLHQNEDKPSMGDKAFDNHRNTKVTNRDGIYTVEVPIGTVTVGDTFTSGIINIVSEDGKIYNVQEEYSLLSDGTMYVSKFTFTTTELADYYMMSFDIAGIDMNQTARLALDFELAEEIGSAESIYYTFGTNKTMFYNGNHSLNVNVLNPGNKSENSILSNSISSNSILNVDGNGTGTVTLRFSDIVIDGVSHQPNNFMYYTSNDMDMSSLKKAEINGNEGSFIISDPDTNGIYISSDIGDTYMSATAFVSLNYANAITSEAYDESKVTDRVVVPTTPEVPSTPAPDNSTGNDSSSGSNTSTTVDITVNGSYTVPTYLYHETSGSLSMGDGAFSSNRETTVTNSNGIYTFEVNASTLTYSGLTGGIANVTSADGTIYDIKQEYSTDINGNKYVSKLLFSTRTISDDYLVSFYIPVMDASVTAKLTFDWYDLKQSTSSGNIVYVYIEVEPTLSLEDLLQEELQAEAEVETGTEEVSDEVDITVNGRYLVPITLMHETKDQVSMGNPAFDQNRYALVTTNNGNYTVTVNPGTITIGDLTSGIGLLVSDDGAMENLQVLEYKTLESNDEYISSFSFTLSELGDAYPITITIPNAPMGATGARLVFDWDKATAAANTVLSGSAIGLTDISQMSEEAGHLTIEHESGTRVSFDNEALKSIIEQADGEDIIVTIDEITAEGLTEAQQEVIGDEHVYFLQVLAGETVIYDFGEGVATVELSYYLERNKNADALSIWCIKEDGEIEEFDCDYEDYDRYISFETSHFSIYSIHFNEDFAYADLVLDEEIEIDYTSEDYVSNSPFEDVSTHDWFYGAVKYTYENKLFSGVTETTFDPLSEVTRGILVTVLHRLAGEPDTNMRNEFTDVLSEQYYTKAILWAVENGIVSGYGDGTFGTSDLVTREQMVTIVYNYASLMGLDMTNTADLTDFTDISDAADYSIDKFKWAIAEKIISGVHHDILMPKGTAKRCEVATVLMNLAKKLNK